MYKFILRVLLLRELKENAQAEIFHKQLFNDESFFGFQIKPEKSGMLVMAPEEVWQGCRQSGDCLAIGWLIESNQFQHTRAVTKRDKMPQRPLYRSTAHVSS